MMMMIGNDRWWLWCDSYDGCDCDDELLCQNKKHNDDDGVCMCI